VLRRTVHRAARQWIRVPREEECCVSFPNTAIASVDFIASHGQSSWVIGSEPPLLVALILPSIYAIATFVGLKLNVMCSFHFPSLIK
jgi:hypothetical protein